MSDTQADPPQEVTLADGTQIPKACVSALDELARIWPGSTLPAARAAVAAAVLGAAEIAEASEVRRLRADVDRLRAMLPRATFAPYDPGEVT